MFREWDGFASQIPWHCTSYRNFRWLNTGNDNRMLWKLAPKFLDQIAALRIYYE
jgi:hypothetical protein